MAKQKHAASACADLATMAVQHAKAAGIDAGDATHWVCVDADGGDKNRFDPSNDYRGHYKSIWGVQ